MQPLVLCHRDTAEVAIMTLNRPEKRNALNINLMQSFHHHLVELEQDPACRVVIVRGADPVFCAGLDLIEAADRSVAEQSGQHVAQLFGALMDSKLISIAMVQGAAMAGGAGLMASCDFVVGSKGVRIGFPEVRRGLVPALVASVLSARLRDSEMRELFLLGDPIDVERAHAMGLVQRIVSTDDLFSESLRIARSICQGGPMTVRQTKSVVREISKRSGAKLEEALAMHTRLRQSDESAEGLAAFAQSRDPNWTP